MKENIGNNILSLIGVFPYWKHTKQSQTCICNRWLCIQSFEKSSAIEHLILLHIFFICYYFFCRPFKSLKLFRKHSLRLVWCHTLGKSYTFYNLHYLILLCTKLITLTRKKNSLSFPWFSFFLSFFLTFPLFPW